MNFEINFFSIFLSLMKVPIQYNSNDCGCFLIFFGKRFFQSPDLVLSLLKVFISHLCLPSLKSTHFRIQTKFSSPEARLVAWDLKSNDMTFVRRDIRSLVFQYIRCGDAVVEYEWRCWMKAKNYLQQIHIQPVFFSYRHNAIFFWF